MMPKWGWFLSYLLIFHMSIKKFYNPELPTSMDITKKEIQEKPAFSCQRAEKGQPRRDLERTLQLWFNIQKHLQAWYAVIFRVPGISVLYSVTESYSGHLYWTWWAPGSSGDTWRNWMAVREITEKHSRPKQHCKKSEN